MKQFVVDSFAPVDVLRWPAMPDPKDRDPIGRGVWIWPRSRIRAYEQVNPKNAHGDGFLIFPYALAVYDGADRHVLSVVVEQTDYRVLAQMTGERLRDLVGERKGHLSELQVSTYHAEAHDELGPYEGVVAHEIVMQTLTEIVADILDLWEEPVRRQWT